MHPTCVVAIRNSTRDIKMRDLYLAIDNADYVSLQFGQSVEIPLEPGDHEIRVTNRISTKKLEFHVAEGEATTFNVACIPSRGLMSLLMIITGTVPYKVSIEQRRSTA